MFSQNEKNNWVFGTKAWLSFQSGSPVPVTGSEIITDEGSASISDYRTGELLFYTDGVTIWDKTHQKMLNGENLWGNKSTTQSSLIIQQPGEQNYYYVFTVSPQAGDFGTGYSGLAYSIVDMALNNGNGAVIPDKKNIPLVHPTSEKVTAVKHANGEDYWIIVHKWNSFSFYTYQLSHNGIIDSVITDIGPKDIGGGQFTIGQLKASPDGRHIASVSTSGNALYDFDNATGIISNYVDLTFKQIDGSTRPCYGCSFSPNSLRLYIGDFARGTGVYQYDLCETDINASQELIGISGYLDTARNILLGCSSFQLGPDGKIYISNNEYSPKLSVINFPDKLGWPASGFEDTTVSLGTGSCGGWGSIANFVDADGPIYLYHSDTALRSADTICLEDTVSFRLNYTPINSTLSWDFADPSSPENTSSEQSPSHIFPAPGIYPVKLRIIKECVTDSFTLPVKVINCHSDSILVPNIFSPNGDSLNDVLRVYTQNISTYDFYVYNRWGSLVYQEDETGKGWDGNVAGQPVERGVYYYVIMAQGLGREVHKRGFITLVRPD